MKAITIWQPWATLIAIGAKPHEFRGWPAPRALRGRRIAIHAGARPVRKSEVKELILRLRNGEADTGLTVEPALELLERVATSPGTLPLSSIVCTAILGVPIRGSALASAMGMPAVNDSDRDQFTNWGWPLTRIEILRPFVPAKGMQGFWDWDGGAA